MNEVTLKEVEVNKINLSPGDTLVVKLKGEQFSESDVYDLQETLKTRFSENKVLVLCFREDSDIVLETIKASDSSVCSDCTCGKSLV